MRVIRTELYFSPETLDELSHSEGDPNVSFAWTKHEQTVVDFRSSEIVGKVFALSSDEIPAFIATVLRDVPYIPTLNWTQVSSIRQTVEYVLQQNIVVERSPPESTPFSALIKGATPIAGIGTYLGIQMASGDTLLMITVPLGILLVGSAVALTKAIEVGLLRIVTGKDTTPPRRVRRRRRSEGGDGGQSAASA
jgi:hypothetical protein